MCRQTKGAISLQSKWTLSMPISVVINKEAPWLAWLDVQGWHGSKCVGDC